VKRVRDFERDLYRFMDTQAQGVGAAVKKEGKLTPEVEQALRGMLDEFKKAHSYAETQA